MANALKAIKCGVNIIQCTINGIGERAGNTSLEELVTALSIKKDIYKTKSNINMKELYKTSKLVAQLTGLCVSPNKAVVGENVFATESGIHQAALLRSRNTYEIIKPESVGQSGTRIVLGRHSGKHAISTRMKELGVKLPRGRQKESVDAIYAHFKEVAARKKKVEDEDLMTIVTKYMEG